MQESVIRFAWWSPKNISANQYWTFCVADDVWWNRKLKKLKGKWFRDDCYDAFAVNWRMFTKRNCLENNNSKTPPCHLMSCINPPNMMVRFYNLQSAIFAFPRYSILGIKITKLNCDYLQINTFNFCYE